MDRGQIIAAIWGLLTGLALIPVYEGAHHAIVRIWNPVGSWYRLLVVMLLATLAACLAAGLLILVPGFLIGAIPVRENAPYFGWSFLAGGLAARVFIELRKRRRKAFL